MTQSDSDSSDTSGIPGIQATPALRARVREAVTRPWVWDLLLAAITAAWSFIFIRLFTPGRINVDIGNQWEQAIGKVPVSDWHPPVMSEVWAVLIDLTGDPGSLLVLQVVLLALAAWLTGVLIHRRGGSRWVSLLGPAVMATPWVVSQMTTLWKDTQMAVALLLGTLLIVITRFVPKAWPLWLPALVLFVYAVGVRKNAVFAVVPIAFYGGYCLVGLWQRRKSTNRPAVLTAVMSLVVLVLIGGGVKATDAMIASHDDVTHTGQISQIFLDDVMFSVPDAQLQAADAPAELKDHISSARDKCLAKGEIWDAYWNCYGRGPSGRAFSPLAYQDELKDLWLHEVITNPLRYVEYRAAVYSMYFFSSKLEYWEFDWHSESDKIGYPLGSAKADFIFEPYVNDFALATFPMLFKPWFWTLIAALLLAGVVHMRRTAAQSPQRKPSPRPSSPHFAPEITVLATSALCYIAGYFPIVPANHFRYTFWPALAVTVACVLALSMWRRGGRVAHDDGPAASDRPDRPAREDAATPPNPTSSESET